MALLIFQAVSARNAMAKCLYGAIFDWIVWQINHSLYQKQDHKDQKVKTTDRPQLSHAGLILRGEF